MLKVYGGPNSQNVQKVMWLVGERGLPTNTSPPVVFTAASLRMSSAK